MNHHVSTAVTDEDLGKLNGTLDGQDLIAQKRKANAIRQMQAATSADKVVSFGFMPRTLDIIW